MTTAIPNFIDRFLFFPKHPVIQKWWLSSRFVCENCFSGWSEISVSVDERKSQSCLCRGSCCCRLASPGERDCQECQQMCSFGVLWDLIIIGAGFMSVTHGSISWCRAQNTSMVDNYLNELHNRPPFSPSSSRSFQHSI